MTCRELSEFLMQYLDGELPDARRRLFEEHLDECPACVAYIASYRTTVRLGKAAFAGDDDAVPAEVPEDLLNAILAAREKG